MSAVLILLSHLALQGTPGVATSQSPNCCPLKTVGGVSYTLLQGAGGDDNIAVADGCKDECVYVRTVDLGQDQPERICFASGYLRVVCDDPSTQTPTTNTTETPPSTPNEATTVSSTASPAPTTGPDTCNGDVPDKPVIVSSKPYDSNHAATNLFTLEEDVFQPRNYFLTPNYYRGDAFTLDLGSCATIAGIRLKNTHGAQHKNRGTKKFALHGAMSSNGPWTKLMEQSLEDARQQASPPVQKFQLSQSKMRFIKFEMLDYWGKGGGLQYFAPFTAAET